MERTQKDIIVQKITLGLDSKDKFLLSKDRIENYYLAGLLDSVNYTDKTASWTENELRLLGAVLILNERINTIMYPTPRSDVSGGGKRKSRKKSAKGKK